MTRLAVLEMSVGVRSAARLLVLRSREEIAERRELVHAGVLAQEPTTITDPLQRINDDPCLACAKEHATGLGVVSTEHTCPEETATSATPASEPASALPGSSSGARDEVPGDQHAAERWSCSFVSRSGTTMGITFLSATEARRFAESHAQASGAPLEWTSTADSSILRTTDGRYLITRTAAE